MKIYEDLTPSPRETAIALGSFDGLHIGHKAVISHVLGQEGLLPGVFTFANNPLCDLGGHAGGELMTREQKELRLTRWGVEVLYLIPFRLVRELSPEEFVVDVLQKVCRAKRVSCGFNFTFGAGGRAGSEDLKRLCAAHGIEAIVQPAVLADGEPVSSTRIRGLVSRGEAGEAARLLGHPYGYLGPVLHGKRLGRTLGTPTLNQAVPKSFCLPRFGVYASVVHIGEERFCGVTNVGVRPTVDGHHVSAETWMPDYHGPELYGKTLQVDLLRFLRPEQKFASVELLGEQIHRDGEKSRNLFLQHVSQMQS